MYPWNTLWQDYAPSLRAIISDYTDANLLSAHLGGPLIKTAQFMGDIAAYDLNNRIIMVRFDSPHMQFIELYKRDLFVIELAIIEDMQDTKHPYHLQIHVNNVATDEAEIWDEPIYLNANGDIWVGRRGLLEGVLPAMPFDNLSFTDNAKFREELTRVWQEEVPLLEPEISALLKPEPAQVLLKHTEESLHSEREHVPNRSASAVQNDRYEYLLRHLFVEVSDTLSAQQLSYLKPIITQHNLDNAQELRGLWRWVEAHVLLNGSEPITLEETQQLLLKLKSFTYPQEVALIEFLERA